ncbi:MAG TPA: hypothetical protein VIS74_05225 [Chthoniobacterales bacterium]
MKNLKSILTVAAVAAFALVSLQGCASKKSCCMTKPTTASYSK